MDVGGILPEELEAHCEHSADGHTLFPCGLHVSRIPTKQGAPRQPVTRGSGGEQYGWETGIEPFILYLHHTQSSHYGMLADLAGNGNSSAALILGASQTYEY